MDLGTRRLLRLKVEDGIESSSAPPTLGRTDERGDTDEDPIDDDPL